MDVSSKALDKAKLQPDFLNKSNVEMITCVCRPIRTPSSVCQRGTQSSAGVYTSVHSVKERM